MGKTLGEFPEPSPELTKKILLRIEKAERRLMMTKAACFGVLLLGSLVLTGYGVMDVMAEAARSGFSAFSSLFFSDFSAKLITSSDYLLSLIESFPVFPTILFLSGVFFAIWSAARFFEEMTLVRRIKLS
jgi:hypothetical protein